MSVKHHPDSATLLAYAAGTLDEAFALIVSCHLSNCADCREQLELANALGGAILTDEALFTDEPNKVEPDAGSFGRLLEKISVENISSDTEQSSQVFIEKNEYDLPLPLRHYIDQNLQEIDWKFAAPGIWQKPIMLSENAQSSLRLLKIRKGKKLPEHGHNGQEMTMILQGAYEDEIGHFGPGDVADLDEDVEHQPIVVSEEDCICLVATEAPTEFKSISSRIMQRFIGI